MTGRERIMSMLKGKKVDRMPISPFLHTNFVNEFYDVDVDEQGSFDRLQKYIDVSDFFVFDLMHRGAHINFDKDMCTEKSSEDGKWIVETEIKNNQGVISEITTITTPERNLRQIKESRKNTKYLRVGAVVEYYIKEHEDFEQFIKYQPPIKKLDTSEISRCINLVGDKGVVVGHSYGAFNYLNNFRKLDDMLTDPYVDEGFYREMMSYFTKRLANVHSQMMEDGVEIINLGMNLASGTAAGPRFFSNFVLEHENLLLEHIHSKGGYNFVHNCGDAKSLFEIYNEMPIDMYESLTQPPYGDTILEEALERFRQDITLCGNMDQVDFLMKATPEQVYEETRKVVMRAKARSNFILGTSDFLFETTPYENIKAFVKAGMDYGVY